MSRIDRVSGNEEAYLEIRNFLRALDSYADRYAQNPNVSFEQYHSALRPVKRRGSRRAMPRTIDYEEKVTS